MKFSLISITALISYLLLVFLPLGIAQTLSLPERPFTDQLSSALAILGFNIILLEFLTTGRIKALSTFLGVDWVLQVHQLFARTAVIFLAIHPFIYTLPSRAIYAPGPPDETHLGLIGPSFTTGMVGLLLLAVLIGLAITRNTSQIKYETWRLSHAVMAVAIALLGFHHTSHAGRFAQEPMMLLYWQCALAIALASVTWVYLIRPLTQKWQPYQVNSVREVAHKIYELNIQSKNNQHLSYQAGQFAWIKLLNSRPLFENPFSISSAPQKSSPQTIQFLIKDVGDFTQQVPQLQAGDLIYLDAPYGNFGHTATNNLQEALVLIAGGAGIAPIMSVLRSFMTGDPAFLEKPILLIYGNRLEAQLIDLSKMMDLHLFKQLSIQAIVTEPSDQWTGLSGVMNTDNLRQACQVLKEKNIDLKNAHFLVCGPAEMIDAVERSLAEMKISLNQIESEKFQYDFSQNNARNRLSLILMSLASCALIASAVYLAK